VEKVALKRNLKTRLEIFPKMKDILYMYVSDFLKGMASIGQLHPAPCPYSDYPPRHNAWKDTANSFRQAGNSLRTALRDFSNAQRESKQTP
jgi:hypothetical protein